MDSPVTERIFEETLTKDQLNDMLKKKIRPVHWVDGTVSYFRIQKIIDILREEKKPLDPNLDIAIAALSGGKAKIRNQSHKELCRDIKAKIDDLEGQTDEDLRQPVECLVPGCFPIGPECESLGISGDVLFNSKKSFPEAIDPASITNRVMFELGEYVTRVKESYESMAGWIKKIMGWGDEYNITAKMVEDWCATLMRDTKKKKKSSLSLAQKYLLERFEFPGMVFPNTTAVNGNEDTNTPSSKQLDDAKKKTESDNRDSSLMDVEFSGDDAEGDKDQDMDISGFLEDASGTDDTPSKKNLSVTSSADNEKAIEEHNDSNSAGDVDKDSHKELSSDEEKEATEASTSQSTRKASSRNAAKVAIGKLRTEPKKQSPQSRGASVASVSKRVTRQAKPSRNMPTRTPAKSTTSKAQRPTKSSSPKRKKESSDESSEDEEDEDEDDDEDEGDDEDEVEDEDDESDNEEDEDEGDEEENDEDSNEDEVDDGSSVEEGEVKTPRRNKLASTRRAKREIAEATKLFKSVSKVLNTLKKEMRIALDYLESETAEIVKNIQKGEKKLADCLMKVEQIQNQSEDEEEEEEETEEEKPVRRTRGSSAQQTKKITVQVKPGVKGKLKKPLLKVTRLPGKNSPSRNPSQTVQSTKPPKTPTKVSRQNVRTTASPRASRSTRSKDTPHESVDEITEFDKEKLFSSRVAVSLTKISEDLVKRALEHNEEINGDDDIEMSDLDESQRDSPTSKKSANKSTRKTPSRQSPESKRDSEGEGEMDDDGDDDEEPVENGEILSTRRGRSGRFRSAGKKNFPKNSASRQSPESKKDSQGEEEMDGDDQESVEEGEISNVTREREKSSRFRSAAKKTFPKNAAFRQSPESKKDSEGEEEMDGNDQESVEEGEISNVTRERKKSGRFRSAGKKNFPKKTPSRQSSESKKDSGGEEEMDGDDQESVEEGEITNETRERQKSGRFRSKKNVPKNTADLRTSKSKSHGMDSGNSDTEKDSSSKKSTRSSSRKNTLKDKGKDVDSSDEEDDKQPTRSSRSVRSRKTKGDTEEATVDSKKEESSSSSWRDRVSSPVENEESSKPSAIDSPYSGSEEEEEDLPKKKSEPSAFAALAAGMSSFGDWRGASAKEKVKKRSLNDFVKMLNSPKRRKTDSGKRASPRKKDENLPNDKSSEEDDTGLMEEENDNDDFLEKQTEMKLQARSTETQDNNKMDGTNGNERDHGSSKEFEMESSGERESREGEQNHSKDSAMGKDCSEDVQAVNKTDSKHREEEFEKEMEDDDEFPGDSIVGKRIRHRCSMGKHGLYKWYEGKVVHKSSASELLKLDEEQFGHLNNLYTFYTVKYDDMDELYAKALEYDWDRENLKIC